MGTSLYKTTPPTERCFSIRDDLNLNRGTTLVAASNKAPLIKVSDSGVIFACGLTEHLSPYDALSVRILRRATGSFNVGILIFQYLHTLLFYHFYRPDASGKNYDLQVICPGRRRNFQKASCRSSRILRRFPKAWLYCPHLEVLRPLPAFPGPASRWEFPYAP